MIKKIKNKGMRIMARFQPTRNLGITLAQKNPKLEKVSNESFEIDVDKYVNEIKVKGFSSPFKIPEQILTDLISYIKRADFEGQYTKEQVKIDYDNPVKPSEDLWYIDKDIYSKCSTAYRLTHDRSLVEIAQNYLGREPRVHNVQAWWSFSPPKGGTPHNYGFHYDIDSFKFLKFFIYLTDVNMDSGPHVIIADTHKKKTWTEKMNRRMTDEQVEKYFDSNRINVMLGRAGEGFFEDTFSYHKGMTPSKPRLIFQVEYTI